jgi:hypothetical protein
MVGVISSLSDSLHGVMLNYYYYYYLNELQMGFYPVTVVLQDTAEGNTHITQNNTPYTKLHKR